MNLQKLFGIFLVILLFAGWQFTASAQTTTPPKSAAQKKYALLIGVEGYKRGVNEDAEWWNLQTTADLTALKQTLIRKFGFAPTDIKTLNTKEATTHAAIVKAFRDLSAQVQTGDIVYLHYSGHGSQILDDNGDEIDGLDESIVPSDYVTRQDGAKNIRDDEIGKFLDELKAKNPASVTFTFDSCFSGTITRGGGRYAERGESYKGKKPKINPAAKANDGTGLLENGKLSNGFVVISATRSDQTAKECDDDKNGSMGALTYALVKAFSAATPRTTYEDLFESVQNTVGQRVQAQNPQIEGNIENALMRGIAIPSEPYINIAVDENKNAILQAGSLQGMTKGSRFALFPNGTKSSSEPSKFADAEIIELDATTSLLKITPLAGKKIDASLPTARAFETEHKYGDNSLKILLPQKDNFLRQAEIAADLQKFPLVVLTKSQNDWDVKIESDAGGAKLSLVRADASKIGDVENNADAAKNVRGALEREVRFRTLRGLENTSPDVAIEMRLVPIVCETNMRGQCAKVTGDKETAKNENGQPILNEGDFFQIEFRNTGQIDAYVTALELSSDGKINPLFPHPRVTMPDNKIKADGQWKRIPSPFIFRVTPPFGKYIYKAIATREFADFSPLLDAQTAAVSRGDNERGGKESQTPLGKLLRSATTAQRSDLGGANPPNWATATINFEVAPKK